MPHNNPASSNTPLALRWSLIGAATGVMVGAVVGLILGLRVNPSTAWFAVIEVGFLAGLAGAVAGLIAGAMVTASRRSKK